MSPLSRFDEIRALVEQYEFEQAARLLEARAPELLAPRVRALLPDVVGTRDQLRQLHARIQALLDAGQVDGKRLPILLASYLALKPNDAEKIALAQRHPPPRPGSTWSNSLGMEFAFIPPGTFWMGSPDGVGEKSERPRHRVTIGTGFFLGVFPVTQEQWQHVMGGNPSRFRGLPAHPVEGVSWHDCHMFLEKINALDAQRDGEYRLPTEAEWEHACRAGTETVFFFGDDSDYLDEFAWFGNNAGDTTHPVGEKQPNPWGLHDILGNVGEWCLDCYGPYAADRQIDPRGPSDGDLRAVRGGAWRSLTRFCRPARRHWLMPEERQDFLGLRVCFQPDV